MNFSSNQFVLQALNHRSKTIILVKNLPTNVTVNEIRDLFSKYGVLGRVVLPPSGITGLLLYDLLKHKNVGDEPNDVWV